LIGVEYSDPAIGSSNDSLQTINFVKATAAMTHYHRLFGRRDFVFVNHLRGGYLANLSPDVKANAGVPAQEAFFLGGRSTLRGFNQGSDDETVPNRWDLFPNKQKNDPPNLRDFRVLSDSYFGLVKAEVWFPMWGIVGGTVFYDGGFVIINQSDVKQPLPYRDSVGMGLRVTTPVGPANIEIGWKLTRRTLRLATDGGYDVKEAPWAIHISIGAI
jgi:outer membrane protein assembly factor BamA